MKRLKLVTLVVFSLGFPIQPIFSVPLYFALPAAQSGLTKLEAWRPIVAYLEEESGVEIALVIARDHKTLIEGMGGRYYDIGCMNALWEARLIRTGKFQTVARAEGPEGPAYSVAIIVNKNSIIRKMEDIGGRYFAMTIPYDALGGFYLPLFLFEREGISPDIVFDQIIYANDDLSILKGVAFGFIDAGVVSSQVLGASASQALSAQVRVIARSEKIPQWALVIRLDTSKKESVSRVIAALVRMQERDEGCKLLSRTQFHGFVSADDAHTACLPSGFIEFCDKIDDALSN